MPIHDTTRKTLEQVVEEYGRYPIEAFEFVRHGLNHTVQQVHGDVSKLSETQCHVTGQQLCWGLRNFALQRYGVMARAVLEHWNIQRSVDFGRIVFAMVDARLMQKTDEDDIRDFENVFDFDKAFEPPARPKAAPKAVFAL